MRKMFIVLLALAAGFVLQTGNAAAQVTPQAVIGNAPSLPSPRQWAANGGHTEAFKAKIAELEGKLSAIMSAQMSNMLSNLDVEKVQATQQRKMREQQRRQERDLKNAQKNMQQAQDAMAMLDLTPAEMSKLGSMSDKEIEAFMRKRMAEKGVSTDAFTTDYSEEDARRDREAETQGQAVAKAQKAQAEYMEQSKVTGKKIGDAERAASKRIAALWESRKDAIMKAGAQCAQPEEVMRGTITKEQLDSYCRRAKALSEDYEAEAYRIWATDYIGVAQGHLKFLMPYAQAFDDAQKVNASFTTGNAALGESNAAASTAGEYLKVTASEPESNM